MASLYDFSARTLAGHDVSMKQFEGEVLLIVNTSSSCGFTPQYKVLQKIHEQYAPRGFAVLGFPCNQFGGQEPGDASQIAAFCEKDYGVSFLMFDKVDVNGTHAHPLYNFLKSEKSGLLGSAIKWNFTKFLVDRAGQVVGRFAPTTTPESLKEKIEALL